MNIHWKVKSFLFRLIDFFGAHNFLYFFQKYITKRSRKASTHVNARLSNYHLNNSLAHRKFIIDHNLDGSLFEFGAGKNLFQNIFLSDIVSNQIIVDINKMIDIELINQSIHDLKKNFESLSNIKTIKSIDELEANYNIKYLAPYDATKTSFDNNYFDSCISTNTLEHIPRNSIILIFKELKRILKKDGLVSAIIDYSDHYSHTDSKIGLLNFLNYSDDQWQKFNHNSHYQNRLRHYDYISIFKSLGYEIIEENLNFEEKNVSTFLNNKFKEFPNSWSATSAHIIMRNL